MGTDYEVMMGIWNKAQGSIRIENNAIGKVVYLNNEIQVQFAKETEQYISIRPIQEWKDKH